jgi:hypothetical protein
VWLSGRVVQGPRFHPQLREEKKKKKEKKRTCRQVVTLMRPFSPNSTSYSSKL